MLKDSNIDPPLLAQVSTWSKPHESIIGNVDDKTVNGGLEKENYGNYAKSQTNFGMKTNTLNTSENSSSNFNVRDAFVFDSPAKRSEEEPNKGKTPRSSHKIVTPLRRQNTSVLLANLESLFNDSQEVSNEIAKMTNNYVLSPASTLTASFASLSTESFTDPLALQSHLQKSMENSTISLCQSTESQKRSCSTSTSSYSINSLYNTPIRYKQSRSHDFSELPSQQRLHRRRSSILAQDEEDLLTLKSTISDLSDLSHFGKDNEELESPSGVDKNIADMTNNEDSDEELEVFELSTHVDKKEDKSELGTKRASRSDRCNLKLPSTEEYRDGSKPPYSYASLIAQAIISSPKQRLALSSIYSWIMETYPYYKVQSCGWQVKQKTNTEI